jgi:hypothetical protein
MNFFNFQSNFHLRVRGLNDPAVEGSELQSMIASSSLQTQQQPVSRMVTT